MKPQVTIEFKNNGDENSKARITFETLEELDGVIATLAEMRDDLEQQIEYERERRRNKRKRAKMRRKNVQQIRDEINKEWTKSFDDFMEKIKNGDDKESFKPVFCWASSLYHTHK